jgi:carbonic anhydrase
MCELCAAPNRPQSVARRSVLRLGLAAAMALAPQALMAKPKAPPKPENVLSPDAALDRLMQGNARYVDGVSRRHDFKHEREPLSRGQNPFAAVLSCADSRIAPEYCFDTGRGDVFVCRLAGNFASDVIIASLEYAVAVLNTPLIIVLGHESCGAVEAAIKSVTEGASFPGHLPELVTALAPAVTEARDMPGDLLVNATRRNVVRNVEKLKTTAPILDTFVKDKKLRVVGGVYQLGSGRVDLIARD